VILACFASRAVRTRALLDIARENCDSRTEHELFLNDTTA
jgi:hypothetical protein